MTKKVVLLFDVDGTLTPARQIISKKMVEFLAEKSRFYCIAVVSGSDEAKVNEQLGNADFLTYCQYLFSENGLVMRRNGNLVSKMNLIEHVGEQKLQGFTNFVLKYLSEIDLPFKRGTFIELRNAMINISPVGRSCNIDERNKFESYDKVYNVRKNMINSLKAQFPSLDFCYSIGGQISFDVFPSGWDKRFCLNHLIKDGYDDIHFFGDKTHEGGNDHEIYCDPRVTGHHVCNPEHTMSIVQEICCQYKPALA